MISLILVLLALVNLYFVLSRKWYASDPFAGMIVSGFILLLALLNLIRLAVT